jgi:hypothetical protein
MLERLAPGFPLIEAESQQVQGIRLIGLERQNRPITFLRRREIAGTMHCDCLLEGGSD